MLDARELVPEMQMDYGQEIRTYNHEHDDQKYRLASEQDADGFEVAAASGFEITEEPREQLLFTRIDYAMKLIRPSRAH